MQWWHASVREAVPAVTGQRMQSTHWNQVKTSAHVANDHISNQMLLQSREIDAHVECQLCHVAREIILSCTNGMPWCVDQYMQAMLALGHQLTAC